MTHPGYFLAKIEDPFEMFPLESVASSLADLAASSYESIAERSGWWGVSRKYYSVEQEHHMEMISLLIGSGFVLAQVAITQTAALAKKLSQHVGKPKWLPHHRGDILQTAATFHVTTRLSDLVIIDAVANYFKHHHEWPLDWNLDDVKEGPRSTIQIAQALGFSPKNHEGNLQIALGSLGLSERSMRSLASGIQEWRERLAEFLRERLCENGLV